MNHDELITTTEVSTALGLSRTRVRVLAKSRGLGLKIGRDWRFTASDVANMRVRVNGRPAGSLNKSALARGPEPG